MKPIQLKQLTEACADWFWQFGRLRKGTYEVSMGTWLDAVCSLRDRAQAMERGQNQKPCMAIWGPSQTGKSTLLSGYLDAQDDPLGDHSALKWHDGEPVRFVVGSDKSDSVLVLNPFNQGSDASGCVSRFILCDSVPDPEHPIEIQLATEAEIMHALAVGYESECHEKNARGEVTAWDADSLRLLLEKHKPAGPILREAYEKVHAIAQTIDLLILSQHGDRGRYSNLSNQWKAVLRPLLLSSPGLLSSMKSVREFVCEFFWDSWPSLSSLYDRLATKREELARLWGSTPLRCSYRIAMLLLDIDAFKQYSAREAVRNWVDAIGWQSGAGGVTLSVGKGPRLFNSREDFGYFQGLVWELRIPIRRDVLAQRSPVLCDFLSKADLLDFPGVANAYGAAEKRTEQDASDLSIGLTEILKRGKTASIVVSRARSLDIDGFSLLMRVSRFPAQPKQLNTGIKSWLQAFSQPWPPQSKTMPLNLVLTFGAKLVNDVNQAGIRSGLDASFSQLQQLGSLTDPKAVTTFATTYPQFHEGQIHGDASQAVAAIINDAAFKARFGDNVASFEEMARNGGTDYFFQHLKLQAEASRRPLIVAQESANAEAQILQLIREHIPSDSAPLEDRSRVIDSWISSIQTLLKTPSNDPGDYDAAARISRHLRRLLNIDHEALEDIPQKAIQRRLPVRVFIEKQFQDWKTRQIKCPSYTGAGLTDTTHAQKALSYLLESVNLSAVEEYFRADLGHISSRSDAHNARRFLAVKMGRELLEGANNSRPADSASVDVRALLECMAKDEENQTFSPDNSPHYRAVIYPFIQRLEQIKKSGAGSRPEQAGDAEISFLLKTAES
ncbi:MAG: virulence factor SrfC family protein [Verrucomicrobiota bacterium]